MTKIEIIDFQQIRPIEHQDTTLIFNKLEKIKPLIFLMEKINVESKSKEFISIMDTQFQGKINLARLKQIAMFVFALCKVQKVGFEKLANAFDTRALAASSLRRIQRFIATDALDSDLIYSVCCLVKKT